MAVIALPVENVEYAADLFDDLFQAMYSDGVVVSGLHASNKLAVTCGGSSPVSVDTGAAWLNGKLVKNTASVDVAIPTPSTATRIDRIIVKITNATGVAEIVRLAGTEGSGEPPDYTTLQVDGTTWAISLCQVSVTTGGVITLTREAERSEPRGMFPVGTLRWWGGSLSGHYPLDPITNAPDTRWHICNGDTEAGVVTPNVADKMLIAAGSTYTKGTAYGSATKDVSHAHNPGTLAVPAHPVHRHAPGTLYWSHQHPLMYGDAVASGSGFSFITDGVDGMSATWSGYTEWNSEQPHGAMTGSTAISGSTTQDVLNPCIGQYLLMRVRD